MKFSKCLALMAAFMVGFGVLGTVEDGHATVKSVSITSPDSGSTRGIDSVVVARVEVQDFSPQDSLTLYVFLATDTTTVISDSDAITTGLLTGQVMASTIRRANDAAGANAIVLNDFGATPSNVFMARHKRGRVLSTQSEGNADSIRVVSKTDSVTTFDWHFKISDAVSTRSGVKVGAFALTGNTNTNAGDTSGIKLSKQTIKIDGDRPTNPTSFHDKAGNVVSNGGGLIDSTDSVGEVTITQFAGASPGNVVNVGDTLTIRSKLGTANLNGVLGSDSLSVKANIFGKDFTLVSNRTLGSNVTRNSDTLRYNLVLASGQFGDLNIQSVANSDTFTVWMVDAAGNVSGSADNTPDGVTAATTLLFDTTAPVLDGATSTSDTLLPAANDTISDGTLNSGFPDDGVGNRSDDIITWKLAEALAELRIIFDGGKEDTVTVANSSRDFVHDALLAGQKRYLDISALDNTGSTRNAYVSHDTSTGAPRDSLFIKADGTFNSEQAQNSATADSLDTGSFTLKFRPTDLAGNVGTEVSRSGVYIDFDAPVLGDLFPTKAAGVDTLEATTAAVVFTLSEAADSVRIAYTGLSGSGRDSVRTKILSGDELSKTTEQQFPITLIDSSQYKLQIQVRDLAGNWIQTDPDTFFFASGFAVPSVTNFKIQAATSGLAAASHLLAGATDVLTITAGASGNRTAVTYGKQAILKVKVNGKDLSGSGVTVTGTGVTKHAQEGLWVLDDGGWIVGKRTITLKDTSAIDTLSISVIDSATTLSDGTNPTGALDSSIVYDPQIYSQLGVSAPTSVGAGDKFWVTVTLQDRYGNTRVLDTRSAVVQANKLMTDAPTNAITMTNGVGGFWAQSHNVGDGLLFEVRDIVRATEAAYPANAADNGKDFIIGKSNSITVDGGSTVLDAPDTLIAEDFMGASGNGDQGGFVMLTFDASDDHGSLTGYRIHREVQVNHGLDSLGNVVNLGSPVSDFIAWGKVDAIPGKGLIEVVVATVDGDTTLWAISAERGNVTTDGKQAFATGVAVDSPYELMAQTMIESKQVAIDGADAPVFATLTPEALSFIDKGVAQRFKEVGSSEVSIKTVSADRIGAIDNIAPEAVPFLNAMDTPGDAGNSITVTWGKSESDRMMTNAFHGAIGTSIPVAGVKGYNVYRAVNGGESVMIGQTDPGETSFVDQAVFNGVRYTYEVKPYDADNLTESSFARTAMAIRNNVKDADGLPVFGLFGTDNTVSFDDFFIFADNFGLKLGDEGYEPAFDLHPNSRVDFNDFFVFADNFGKTANVAGKVVPNLVAGLNGDARIDLAKDMVLPRIGEEMVIDVTLADFAEVKGYGFTVNYDGTALEFVKAVAENNRLGEGDLAQPQILADTDGEIVLGAFGEIVSEGDVELSLVFRPKAEIEQSLIEVSAGELRDGNYALNQIASLGVVSVETRPEAFALLNNYPNPFNPETTIKYHLPEAAQVKLEVYNMVGQVVRTLVNNQQNAGRYVVQWNAANDNGQNLASGIYLYRIQAGDFHEVKKMLLLK